MRYFILLLITLPCYLNAQTLRFLAEDLPPLHFLDEHQQPRGFLVDLTKLLLKESQLQGDVEILPMARAFEQTQRHSNTVMMSLLHTPKRSKHFSWIGKSYHSTAYLVSRNNFKNNAKNILEVDSSIATIRGYYSESYLKSKGFIEGYNLILASDNKALWQMLLKKRCDYILTNTLTMERELNSLNIDSSSVKRTIQINDFPSNLFFASNKNLPKETKSKLIKSLIQLKSSGQYQQLLEQWQLKNSAVR